MKNITFISGAIEHNGAIHSMIPLVKLLKNSYAVTVLTHFSNCEVNLLEINHITADKKRKNVISKIYSKLRFMYYIYQQSSKSDVIISEENFTITIPSVFICKLLGKPFIIWNHSCRGEFFTTNKFVNHLYKRSYQKSTHIVNVSLYAQNCLHNFTNIKSNKTSIIYNIIKNNNITNLNTPNLENIKLISIGSLNKNKNFELTINSVYLLKHKYGINCTLTICGAGTYKQKLKKLIARLGLESYVVLYGIAQDVYPLISASDILISASNSESFSLTVTEALSCNTPVIATNTGASEILNNGEYGTIIEKNNLTQMTNAILNIMNNYPQAKEKAILGNKSLSRFSESKILPQWLELIERLT